MCNTESESASAKFFLKNREFTNDIKTSQMSKQMNNVQNSMNKTVQGRDSGQ